VVQALDDLLPWPLPALAEPTLKLEKSFVIFFEEQKGHFVLFWSLLDTRSSKIFLHLAHSYSNMGKVIPPTALPTIS
jgi:hypothetical protein